jgi:hypothetical protein
MLQIILEEYFLVRCSFKENDRNKGRKIDHQNLKGNIKEALRWGETEKE